MIIPASTSALSAATRAASKGATPGVRNLLDRISEEAVRPARDGVEPAVTLGRIRDDASRPRIERDAAAMILRAMPVKAW